MVQSESDATSRSSTTRADPAGPMRVVIVTPGFLPDRGGVETHTGRLAAELATRGLDVRVLTARRGLDRAVEEEYAGVPVRRYPAWRLSAMSLSPRLLGAALSAYRDADLVHVHSYHASCGLAAITGWRAPVVLTPHYHGGGHSPLAVAVHRLYRHLGRAAFGAAAAIVCVSRAERQAIVRDFPSTAGSTHVVPNGVDIEAIRAAVAFPGQPPTVLSLGRLEPYKRVAELLRAVPAMPPDTQLVLIGEGSQREHLESLARQLGVSARVQFTGGIDTEAMHRWLRTARVLLSLSEHEAFGMAPVEAAAAGARVVLSDIPAHREIVADYLGGTARLVDADPVAVAAAVTDQLALPGRAEVDVPDWRSIADRTAEVYRRVILAKAGPNAVKGTAVTSALHTATGDDARARGHRMASIDRPWSGHRSVLVVTPLEVASPEAIRDAFAEFMCAHPDSPLSGRMDERKGRWLRVGASERAAHLDRVLVPADDPEPEGIEEHVHKHLAMVAPDLPFVAVVGTRTVSLYMSHALGDATVLSALLSAVALADSGRLDALQRRTGMAAVLRALARQSVSHRREWIGHLRSPDGPPVVDASPGSAAVSSPRPAIAESVASNATMRAVTKWRTANAPGSSLTAILTTAAYRALTRSGLNVHSGGFYTLVDSRSVLPKAEQPVYGNLAKAMYLAADLDDPQSVGASLRATTDSHRALPATVLGALTGALRPTRSERPHPAGAPLILTVNSVPTPPGLSELPWRADGQRRYVPIGFSAGPGGITLFAVRLRDHLQLAVSFDETTAPADSVRAGLTMLSDPAGMIAALSGEA